MNGKSGSAANARVLVIDDDLAMAETIADGLAEHAFLGIPIADPVRALEAINAADYSALVVDLRIPGSDGLALLAASRASLPEAPVIVMTAFSGLDTAIESIRRGAYHYLTKPFKVEELALFLARALDESALRREARTLRSALHSSLENVVGSSAAMRDVFDVVRRAADSSVPVLLLGETGTGKGLVARALHVESHRSKEAFVVINCAAIPDALLESELFGHVRGAFTGASSDRTGLFQQAHHGTLILDEIGELPLHLQAKLLQVLETGRVRKVGSNRDNEADVRVVAATHRNLRERVEQGLFREDLLYRLDVVSIEIPPLRQRKEDISELVGHFLAAARERNPRSTLLRLSHDAMAALLAYSWPGNVRELKHLIERLAVLCPFEEATVAELPRQLTLPTPERKELYFGEKVLPVREIQRRYAAWALQQLGGAKMATCEALGIDAKTLQKWLRSDSPAGD
jgi:two-component system response regulator HydG